jgi:hypothetical protein
MLPLVKQSACLAHGSGDKRRRGSRRTRADWACNSLCRKDKWRIRRPRLCGKITLIAATGQRSRESCRQDVAAGDPGSGVADLRDPRPHFSTLRQTSARARRAIPFTLHHDEAAQRPAHGHYGAVTSPPRPEHTPRLTPCLTPIAKRTRRGKITLGRPMPTVCRACDAPEASGRAMSFEPPQGQPPLANARPEHCGSRLHPTLDHAKTKKGGGFRPLPAYRYGLVTRRPDQSLSCPPRCSLASSSW